MPISNSARKSEVCKIARQRGVSYTTALRFIEAREAKRQAARAASPGPNIWGDVWATGKSALDAALATSYERLLIISPPSLATSIEEQVKRTIKDARGPVVVISGSGSADVTFPEKGTVILSGHAMSVMDQPQRNAVANWRAQVVALPHAADMLNFRSKRGTLARRLARQAEIAYAAVPTFGALRPTELKSLLELTGHIRTTFEGRFVDDYMHWVPGSFRHGGDRIQVMTYNPERTPTLESVMRERVLADEPVRWPWASSGLGGTRSGQ